MFDRFSSNVCLYTIAIVTVLALVATIIFVYVAIIIFVFFAIILVVFIIIGTVLTILVTLASPIIQGERILENKYPAIL